MAQVRVPVPAGSTPWPRRLMTPMLICLGWMILVGWLLAHLDGRDQAPAALLLLLPLSWTVLVCLKTDRWRPSPWRRGGAAGGGPDAPARTIEGNPPGSCPPEEDSLTGSGLFDTPSGAISAGDDGLVTGEFSIIDMVNRLEPRGFRWIDSSLAEQEFLGFVLNELKARSFLDIVHPDDRSVAEEALRQVLAKGEIHGVVVRVRTAQGKTKAVELNAGARYNAEHRVTYLRCHLTDVTEKLRSERELRLRTRELIRVNEQLRQINRELEDLKDRYTDLYENAPAMYFSLDSQGRLVECNQTLLTALDRRREDLLGQGMERFVAAADLGRCHALLERLPQLGSIETESRWVKSGGELIDVWVSGRATPGAGPQTRCVAQDITAKRQLEADLRATNQSLERANAELSTKNRELDEFVYVVSHDLQEPLRTLTAFSDFLLKDHAERLDPEGSQYVRHLVDASQRMKSMIGALLRLSRAGKVTDEFAQVALADLVAVVRADLGALIRNRAADVRLVDPHVTLWGDRRRLEQLLANLVSNGIKYNRSPVPTVEIGLFRSPGEPANPEAVPMQTILVRDNGIGIDPKHHRRIFQLFRRLHAQEEFEGTGVGLTICSKIVQAHGGDICLESEPGKGTTFYFSLPRGPVLSPSQSGSTAGPQNPASAG